MWSKYIETELGDIAFKKMNKNNLHYHNWNHILSMFEYLNSNNHNYDPHLDVAILFHDSVYDSKPNKELRSVDFFNEIIKDYNFDIDYIEISNLIHMTIEHKINKYSTTNERAIIRADLHQLCSGKHSFLNFHKIMKESIHLYNINEEEFAKNNLKFMKKMKETCLNNLDNDYPEFENFWKKVIDGVNDTETTSKIILRN